MRIGIDFDNTIVNYDGVFYRTAVQLGWLDATVGQSKNEVKQYFISRDNESRWTELQGIVYGETIQQAAPYFEVKESLTELRNRGATLFLISHKTRYPIIGEKRDFHRAARQWLDSRELTMLFNELYFCPEKDLKIARISALDLDWFVDDLPSILQHPDFPSATQSLLFDPDNHHQVPLNTARSWSEIPKLLEA